MNTAQAGPIWNRAVWVVPPAVETDAPMPTASDEPNESNSAACGMCRNRPCLFSWLHITPDELTISTLERS